MPDASNTIPDRILRLSEVKRLTSRSRTAIYTDPSFPARIEIGPRAVGWSLAEVLDWIDVKKRARQQREGCVLPGPLAQANRSKASLRTAQDAA